MKKKKDSLKAFEEIHSQSKKKTKQKTSVDDDIYCIFFSIFPLAVSQQRV